MLPPSGPVSQTPTVPTVPTVSTVLTPTLGPLRAPEAFSERSAVPVDIWFAALEFYLEETGVQAQHRVRVALRHFDAGSYYRIKSARLDQTSDWSDFKARVKGLFGRGESVGALQERLFSVQQRTDESGQRFAARVLDAAMKAYPGFSFTDQRAVASGLLLNGLADAEVQREARLRLTDLGSSEADWVRAVDLISLLEAEARSGRLRGQGVAPVRADEASQKPDEGLTRGGYRPSREEAWQRFRGRSRSGPLFGGRGRYRPYSTNNTYSTFMQRGPLRGTRAPSGNWRAPNSQSFGPYQPETQSQYGVKALHFQQEQDGGEGAQPPKPPSRMGDGRDFVLTVLSPDIGVGANRRLAGHRTLHVKGVRGKTVLVENPRNGVRHLVSHDFLKHCYSAQAVTKGSQSQSCDDRPSAQQHAGAESARAGLTHRWHRVLTAR